MQVGAGAGLLLGRWLGGPEKIKALIPVASIAVAAAFNTPLAAMYARWKKLQMHAPVLGSVVLASRVSWAMLRLLLGDDSLFKVPQYQLVSPAKESIYAILGLLGACCSISKVVAQTARAISAAAAKTMWFQPAMEGSGHCRGVVSASDPGSGVRLRQGKC